MNFGFPTRTDYYKSSQIRKSRVGNPEMPGRESNPSLHRCILLTELISGLTFGILELLQVPVTPHKFGVECNVIDVFHHPILQQPSKSNVLLSY